MVSLTLASDFPTATRDDWLKLVGDVEKLRATTYDGFTIEPLYTAADAVDGAGLPGLAPFVRGRTAAGNRAGWDIRQVVDPAHGDRLAVEELERGATSIWLRLRGATDLEDGVRRALNGVLLDRAPVVLDAGPRWLPAATELTRTWQRQRLDPAAVSGSFGADPSGDWFVDRGAVDLDADLRALASEAGILAAEHPNVRVATIDGTRFHDMGASDAQELGFALAVTVATMRALNERIDVADAFGQFELRLAATVDQFATIAKIRAARRLLARVAEVCGSPDAAGDVPLHAVTSRAMAARYDTAVNMLRSSIACFAAGVGGADAITVLPHDELVTPAGSELGRRLARNTQLVLAMESSITRVIDAAGGSWYVERLTDQLAEAAWAVFQDVESAGGFRAAVEAGIVDERIGETRTRRDTDIDHRRAPLTGLSEYPNVAESLAGSASPVPGLHRWSERFEALRQRVDAHVASGPARPSVYLATIGTPAEFTERATFAANFYGIAGIDTVRGPVDGFASSATPVACVCSNDAHLDEHGDETIERLRAAGATRVDVAGRTIKAGDDARAALAELVEHLEIRR